jgi:amino acid transporter
MTPLRAIWATTLISILPGLLDLASPIAANAIFSLTTIALDLSYIIPIFLRRVFQNHPEVMFKPGPFYMGDGLLGWVCNCTCITWTLFVCVLLSLPTIQPVTAQNMNYASVCTYHYHLRRPWPRINNSLFCPGHHCRSFDTFIVRSWLC